MGTSETREVPTEPAQKINLGMFIYVCAACTEGSAPGSTRRHWHFPFLAE